MSWERKYRCEDPVRCIRLGHSHPRNQCFPSTYCPSRWLRHRSGWHRISRL